MKTYQVEFKYRDRNEAEAGSSVKIQASALPGAVAKAAREFVKGLDRKQRFDMNKSGLDIKVRQVESDEAPSEPSQHSSAATA
jgi:hypothetical protein